MTAFACRLPLKISNRTANGKIHISIFQFGRERIERHRRDGWGNMRRIKEDRGLTGLVPLGYLVPCVWVASLEMGIGEDRYASETLAMAHSARSSGSRWARSLRHSFSCRAWRSALACLHEQPPAPCPQGRRPFWQLPVEGPVQGPGFGPPPRADEGSPAVRLQQVAASTLRWPTIRRADDGGWSRCRRRSPKIVRASHRTPQTGWLGQHATP